MAYAVLVIQGWVLKVYVPTNLISLCDNKNYEDIDVEFVTSKNFTYLSSKT